ncbi:MAG TPA: hypothetical protein VM580_28380, partial [Labilithrix sp.]|nr:hypothetical protein [Labilithrix sp.]
WPGFLPDSESLVFQQQVAAGIDGNDNGELHTRKGARANISWTSVTDATKVTPLDQRNGKNANGIYLPKLSTPVSMSCAGDGHEVGNDDPSHAEDVNFNYEPTVSPAPSGGYAWVVFTSRRLYGNLATIPPFCSDPRGVNLVQNITPKKLWVAAIDLSAKLGTDASHPAFYLPAQELLAGNTRGYGVALVVLGAASRSTAATTGCACARRQSFDRTRKPAIRFYGRRRACLRSFSHTLPSASVASAHNDTLLRPVTAIARTTRLMMLRTANEAPTIATLISNSSIFLAAMTFRASLVTPLALRVSEITKIRPSGAACARAMRKSTSSAASASKIVPT